jgi:hypothetical protein
MRMGLRKGDNRKPFNINIKWIVVGVILFVVTVLVATFSTLGAICCFLFGISSILYSIDRVIAHRVGLGFFGAALVVLGIVVKLHLSC